MYFEKNRKVDKREVTAELQVKYLKLAMSYGRLKK